MNRYQYAALVNHYNSEKILKLDSISMFYNTNPRLWRGELHPRSRLCLFSLHCGSQPDHQPAIRQYPGSLGDKQDLLQWWWDILRFYNQGTEHSVCAKPKLAGLLLAIICTLRSRLCLDQPGSRRIQYKSKLCMRTIYEDIVCSWHRKITPL